jgi:hypothetical protein
VAFLLSIVIPVEGMSMDETLQIAQSLLESSHVSVEDSARVREAGHMAMILFRSDEDRKTAHAILTKAGMCLGPILTVKTRRRPPA